MQRSAASGGTPSHDLLLRICREKMCKSCDVHGVRNETGSSVYDDVVRLGAAKVIFLGKLV